MLSRVIRTAELAVVIPRDAFDDRFGEAVDVAEEQGGFVADSRSRERSGSLTVRVPAPNFDETLRALRALGTVEVESVHGKDVTADYVDIHANLRIARARREVLLGLMADAVSIEQTIRVQNALDETQLRSSSFRDSSGSSTTAPRSRRSASACANRASSRSPRSRRRASRTPSSGRWPASSG